MFILVGHGSKYYLGTHSIVTTFQIILNGISISFSCYVGKAPNLIQRYSNYLYLRKKNLSKEKTYIENKEPHISEVLHFEPI